MRIPTIEGVMGRRLLVNFRVSPERMGALLPAPFRCKLVDGWAVAGICLIRLESIRPRGFPAMLGLSSENAAHRVAVEWDDRGVVRQGVYIPRRDTDSHLTALSGGRLFPGEQHLAQFESHETDDKISVSLTSQDGSVRVEVAGQPTGEWPGDSIFPTFSDVDRFFQSCSVGYSACQDPHHFHGMELFCPQWKAQPFQVDSVKSSFFDDPTLFPAGTAVFDGALVMRNIPHEWHECGEICCS